MANYTPTPTLEYDDVGFSSDVLESVARIYGRPNAALADAIRAATGNGVSVQAIGNWRGSRKDPSGTATRRVNLTPDHANRLARAMDVLVPPAPGQAPFPPALFMSSDPWGAIMWLAENRRQVLPGVGVPDQGEALSGYKLAALVAA